MSLVEKEVTLKNVEQARRNPEFEKRQEIEHKLVPVRPEILTWLYKENAEPIEQIYLSNPGDEFSLRVRRIGTGATERFTATLKDRGEIVDGALRRTEVETAISPELFHYYQAMGLPRLSKSRAVIADGVHVDFYENNTTPAIVEVEHADAELRSETVALVEELGGPLVNQSDNVAITNEALAHQQYAERSLEKVPRKPESLDAFTHRVLGEMIAQYTIGKNQVVVGLTGMSGSGKTTVTRGLQERIVELFGESYAPIVVSTDDYHFGKTALEARYGAPYTEWDSPKTYNTEELAADLALLAEGHPLIKRHFDFETEEPVFDEEVAPSPFVIVEGLYASSKDLHNVRDLHFELPTSIATSVGRDIRRLIIENRANRVFPTPESRLKYQIETALPLYLEQGKPERKAFSASVRPLAERAFMLSDVSKLADEI